MATHEDSPEFIFRWDLDKTYLATEFASTLDLLRTFAQTAHEKTNIPGADVLLRELLQPDHKRRRALTFVSGSPEQMRSVLEEKLRLDGITPDHFVLKPNLQNLLRGRFRALRGQIGYKLKTLLEIRLRSTTSTEVLFGDDAEQDALIYSLYADIVSGRVGRALVKDLLKAARVYPDTASEILELIRQNPLEDSVGRIFINLESHSPTARFLPFGGRLVPIHNYFQAALILFEDGALGASSTVRVATSMMQEHQYSPAMLANSFQDLVRRRRLTRATALKLAEDLTAARRPEFASSELNLAEFAERLRIIQGSAGAALLGDVGIPDYKTILKSFH